jgi:hypothetical protein
MLVTKQQIIELALSSLGINSSILDIQPEESALALKKLDLLAAQLLGDGYLFTYVVPDSLGDSTLNDEWELEDWAVGPLSDMLALKTANDFSKPITATLVTAAVYGKSILETNSIKALTSRPLSPMTIMGAGNVRFGSTFAYETTNYTTT